MNVLDINRSDFEGACYHASQALMWNARQQTDPSKMLCFAAAAQYADEYANRVKGMHRDKVLAAFDLSLPQQDREALSGVPKAEDLPPETTSQLNLLIEDTAYLHARTDISNKAIDSASPNFAAEAVAFASEIAGFSEGEVGSHVAELQRAVGSPSKDSAPSYGVPTISFKSDLAGMTYTLALCTSRYQRDGNLALVALDLSEPIEDGFVETWGALSVNLPDDPVAASWCAQDGNIVLDTNNNSQALVDALVSANVVELTGETVFSGFCAYPLATITPEAMGRLKDHVETAARILESARNARTSPTHDDRNEDVFLMGGAEAARDHAGPLPGEDDPSHSDYER